MHLSVIGAGPAYTDRPGATGASYLLQHNGSSLLLDLGQGSFPRLAGTVDPANLDAVLISHLHPDHFVDLVALRHYLRWEAKRRVHVLGPEGLGARLDALHDDPGFCAAALDIETLAEGPLTIGAFAVDIGRVTHTTDSFGFRVAVGSDGAAGTGTGAASDQPGLVYSGDCGRAEDLDALARPGDTLLCEVSFGPGPVVHDAKHLDGPAVGDLATRVGAGRVLLTHIQMGFDRDATMDSVRARFDGPIEMVDPGFETDIAH